MFKKWFSYLILEIEKGIKKLLSLLAVSFPSSI